MSEKKGGVVAKRFFVQSTEDVFKRLGHLAIDLGERGVEKLGGKLLEEAVARKEAELRSAPARKPPAR